ncbi:MAG TPA: cysteine peptidase family C39 domain-containing protein [Kofleriaceae bacterium]|jgi:hypothetical protein|nr:cysteine peptidase family C39 domain-containing protein [Kofleriaceae bacterium]
MRRLGAVLALSVAACISYSGGARPFDPARLWTETTWIVAASTSALRQRGSQDCGAAALAMVASHWHVSLSVDEAIAALPSATQNGVRLGDLRDTARARGLTAFAIAGDRATLVHELRAGRPDEIIRATVGAHNVLLDLEERSDAELSILSNHYTTLATQARADVLGGLVDTGVGGDA